MQRDYNTELVNHKKAEAELASKTEMITQIQEFHK